MCSFDADPQPKRAKRAHDVAVGSDLEMNPTPQVSAEDAARLALYTTFRPVNHPITAGEQVRVLVCTAALRGAGSTGMTPGGKVALETRGNVAQRAGAQRRRCRRRSSADPPSGLRQLLFAGRRDGQQAAGRGAQYVLLASLPPTRPSVLAPTTNSAAAHLRFVAQASLACWISVQRCATRRSASTTSRSLSGEKATRAADRTYVACARPSRGLWSPAHRGGFGRPPTAGALVARRSCRARRCSPLPSRLPRPHVPTRTTTFLPCRRMARPCTTTRSDSAFRSTSGDIAPSRCVARRLWTLLPPPRPASHASLHLQAARQPAARRPATFAALIISFAVVEQNVQRDAGRAQP